MAIGGVAPASAEQSDASREAVQDGMRRQEGDSCRREFDGEWDPIQSLDNIRDVGDLLGCRCEQWIGCPRAIHEELKGRGSPPAVPSRRSDGKRERLDREDLFAT